MRNSQREEGFDEGYAKHGSKPGEGPKHVCWFIKEMQDCGNKDEWVKRLYSCLHREPKGLISESTREPKCLPEKGSRPASLLLDPTYECRG